MKLVYFWKPKQNSKFVITKLLILLVCTFIRFLINLEIFFLLLRFTEIIFIYLLWIFWWKKLRKKLCFCWNFRNYWNFKYYMNLTEIFRLKFWDWRRMNKIIGYDLLWIFSIIWTNEKASWRIFMTTY